MEIGPNLCVWPIQSGINHELNSMQTLSPIVQQNNSFVYSRSNGVVLELESDSETELESTPHLDHHGPIESKHQENPCQSQWNNGLINLSTNDEEDYDQCIEKIDFDEYNLRNNLNVNILNDHGNTVDRKVELGKQISIDDKNHQNLQNFHDKTDDNDNNSNNNKDYTCGFCGFDFGTAEQVEEHVLLKHTDNLTTSNYSGTTPTNTSDSSSIALTTIITTSNSNCSSSTVTIAKNSKYSVDPASKFNGPRSQGKESRKSLNKDNEVLKEFAKKSSTVEMEDQQVIRSDNDFPALVTNNPMITDCPLCDRTFVGRRSLNIHLNKTHSIKENGSNINNSTNSNSIDNPGSVTNNTDAEQLKTNSVSKLTRLTFARSLRGLGGNKNCDINNNNNDNKTTNETTKSTSEKSLCKIVVRPPILPRPSRMTNSIIGSSTSPSKTNVDKKNLQSESSSSSSISQDISVSRNNESEELSPQKSRPTVYAVSPPLATEQRISLAISKYSLKMFLLTVN
uniref:C2H2-type domain-containing protein n=1 Tax=Schistosoma mansoni TaxID=6183 RepID=A0A5K4FAH0_SCHMA